MNYESEYDNRARVPEHPAILAGWARDAADARDVLHPQLELPYGPDPRQAFDFFHPSGESGATTLFVHGGFWRAFDKNAFSHMARGLVAHSLAVAIPSYRLCPSVRVGDIIDDVRSCARRVHTITGRRLVIVGHSAGGQLAACLLATYWPSLDTPLPANLVPAIYAISGLFDLTPLLSTRINNALGLDAHEARDASPIHWPPPAGRSFDAVVGEQESAEYHRQAREIVARWGEGGVRTHLRSIPGCNHFTVIAQLTDPQIAMVKRIAELASL